MDNYKKLINLYENDLHIPNNEMCNICDSTFKQPLLPWQVGNKYFTDNGGIFIAGKPHRGTPGKVRDSNVIDGREVGKKLFFGKSWPYWSYTKEILNILFETSEESWEHITFSNIVKCTSTNSDDNTSLQCAKQCIVENKVIFKEIELLKPRKILFFTWSMHRHLLNDIPIAKNETIIEHTNNKFRKNCGAKKLGWWERSFTAKWGSKVDFLIVGHPERMKKVEYVNMVAEWLKKP